jgi:hypothetical protein
MRKILLAIFDSFSEFEITVATESADGGIYKMKLLVRGI